MLKHRRWRCVACRYQVSLTAGTILHNTKMPLAVWFWAAYLMTTDKTGDLGAAAPTATGASALRDRVDAVAQAAPGDGQHERLVHCAAVVIQLAHALVEESEIPASLVVGQADRFGILRRVLRPSLPVSRYFALPAVAFIYTAKPPPTRTVLSASTPLVTAVPLKK